MPSIHIARARSTDKECVLCRKIPKEWAKGDMWTSSESERVRLLEEGFHSDCRNKSPS